MALGICEKYDLSSHIEMIKASDGEKYSFCEGDELSKSLEGASAERAQEIYDNCFGKGVHYPARISSHLIDARYMRWQKSVRVRSCIKDAVQEGEAMYGANSEKMREVRISTAKAAAEFEYGIEDLVKPILETSIEDKTGRELVNLHIQQCHAKVLTEFHKSYDSIFLKAVNDIESICGNFSLEMLKMNELIVEFYHKKLWEQWEMLYLGRRVEIYQKMFENNHIEIAKANLEISKICIWGRKFSGAILCVEEALKILIEFYGEVDPVVSEAYWMLVETCAANKESAKCLRALFKRLRIQEKLGDKNIYQTYEAIGVVYGQLKDTENSRSYLRKACQMIKLELGIDNEWTRETKMRERNIARLKDLLENN